MKGMARKLRCFWTVLLIMVLCGSVFAETGDAKDAKKILSSVEDARYFVEMLLGDDASSLDGAYQMTKMMDTAMLLSGGFGGLARQLGSLGELQEICPGYETVVQGRKAFRVPCRFSVQSIDFLFVMDGDSVSGLTLQEFTGTEPTEQQPEGNEAQEPANADSAFDSVELALPVPEMEEELPGTLTLPKGDGPFPAVVMVHGSGPGDRDETTGSLTPFKDIAEGLAEKGIAVYRFDKRTFVLGLQMAADTSVTLKEESINDAAAAVQLLAKQDKIDPDRIFVAGHSLGAAAIPAVDQALKTEPVQACGYILLAPPARRLDVVMREQYEFLSALSPEIAAQKDAMFAELDHLAELDSLPEDFMIAGAYVPYWKWLADYDILEEARKITLPCLLLQGEEDYQATMEDFSLFQEAVGDRENWTLVSFPGLVHAFIHGEKAEGAAVYQKDERVDPVVIADMADFINSTSDAAEKK